MSACGCGGGCGAPAASTLARGRTTAGYPGWEGRAPHPGLLAASRGYPTAHLARSTGTIYSLALAASLKPGRGATTHAKHAGPSDGLDRDEAADDAIELPFEEKIEKFTSECWDISYRKTIDCCDGRCKHGPCGYGCDGDAGCESLEVPSGWRSNDCASTIKGKPDDCSACINEKSTDDFEYMLSVAEEDTKKVINIWYETDTEHALLSAAWKLLMDNLDLIEWTACVVFGDTSYYECLKKRIEGNGINVTLKVKDYVSRSDTISASSYSGRGRSINIGTEAFHDTWRSTLSLFETSMDISYRACGVISAASLLFHELLHMCDWPMEKGTSAHNSDGANTCDSVYVGQSVFSFALKSRYPFIRGTCCESMYDSFAVPNNAAAQTCY